MSASHGISLSSVPVFINASPEFPQEVHNVAGNVVFHKNAADVDSGDTELGEGESVQITEGRYFISTTTSTVVVRELTAKTFEDVATVDDLTVGDKLTVVGEAELDGALNHDGTKAGFLGAAPVAVQEVAKEEGEEKKATVAELQEALEAFGLIKEEA